MVRRDRWLLTAANSPAMTVHLGGPETDAELDARQERFLRPGREGSARMFVVERSVEAAAGIGCWQLDGRRIGTGRTSASDTLRRHEGGLKPAPGSGGETGRTVPSPSTVRSRTTPRS